MSRDIYVVAEQRNGKVQRVTLELMSEAKKLAAQLEQDVKVVLMGSGMDEAAKYLASCGAGEVLVVDHPLLKTYVTEPYAKALTAIIEERDPDIVLFGASSIGRDLAPRVAARVHTGLTADCTGLAIDEEDKLLHMTRPAFGGNIMATIICPQYRPQMATVRPGVMKIDAVEDAVPAAITPVAVALEESDMNVKVLEISAKGTKHVDISKATVLVSGGRGMGNKENFQLLHDLAAELKGEVSSSRICVDDGWTDKERQVGQTGKTVRPKLYMACGISGALQHVAGMEESEFILAINKDSNAGIMKTADLGIVGNAQEIVPLLTKAVQKYKMEKA